MPPRSKFYKTQWAWQSVKLSRLISIFTSKNVWKFLIKIQLTKSNQKIIRGVNPPCLMPTRVKTAFDETFFVNKKLSANKLNSWYLVIIKDNFIIWDEDNCALSFGSFYNLCKFCWKNVQLIQRKNWGEKIKKPNY